MTVYYDHPDRNEKQLLFPKVQIFTALGFGLVGSAVILWHSCFSHALISEMVLKLAFFLTISLVVFLLTVTPTTNHDTHSTEAQSASDNRLSPWKALKENKFPIFFTVLLLACVVIILSGVPYSGSRLYEDWERVAIFKEVMFSVITKFAVGIVLPVSLYELINSSYVGKKLQTATACVI